MPTAKTSVSDPLRIAMVTPDGTQGRIGITLCPGKTDNTARFGPWARDLDLDLDVIQHWGATALISLIEDQEFDRFSVRGLGSAVEHRHMEWWHLPIPDGSPPGPVFETAWGDAGGAIRDRLRSGFDVVIHCRGGLGRAGTIAARLLVELGMRPDEAVRRVRDARGPGAIETPAQEAHVLGCVPQSSADPFRTMESIRNRALGAFLGLAVGDAVGTTLEFSPRDAQPRLVDMVGGGPFELTAGAWTDDTAMALALADNLAASEVLDCRDVMDRFVDWRNHGDYSCTGRCLDIGATTSQALDRYLQTGDPIDGSTDPRSAGNGSLMRLAPVALRFWDDRAAPGLDRRGPVSHDARGRRSRGMPAGPMQSCSQTRLPAGRARHCSPRGSSTGCLRSPVS